MNDIYVVREDDKYRLYIKAKNSELGSMRLSLILDEGDVKQLVRSSELALLNRSNDYIFGTDDE
jgi:hypothetical protein